MPGTPATSPNFGAPRYSNADADDFATQVNAVTDTFDAAAAKRGSIVDSDIAGNANLSPSKILGMVIDQNNWAALALPAGYTGGVLTVDGLIPGPEYVVLASGLVVFRGVLLHNFPSGSFPTGLTFGPLPPGARPVQLDYAGLDVWQGVDSADDIRSEMTDTLRALVKLKTDGTLVLDGVAGAINPNANNHYLSFNGLTFSTG